jgi:Putative Flp pilus-assembly TadE/G-like
MSGRAPMLRRERGQASVELLGALPVLLLIGLAVFQLLAVGYAKVQAGSAAEAAALALVAGGDPRAAARESLPGWSRAQARISQRDGLVRVSLRPPSLPGLGRRLEVEAEAAVEEGE